jgi:hypothetical protein
MARKAGLCRNRLSSRSRLCNARNLLRRARERAVFSGFRRGLLELDYKSDDATISRMYQRFIKWADLKIFKYVWLVLGTHVR